MTTRRIPVVDGLFDLDGPALLGSRCDGCATASFPASPTCPNPNCTDKRPGPARFGSHGTLYSWTVQAYRPPALFTMEPWEPYALGLVDLPEGLRVLAMLTRCRPEDLAIGMDLDLVVEALRVDPEGTEVVTYKYAPAAPS